MILDHIKISLQISGRYRRADPVKGEPMATYKTGLGQSGDSGSTGKL